MESGLWCGLEYHRLDWCRGVPARMCLQDLHRMEQPLLCSLSLDVAVAGLTGSGRGWGRVLVLDFRVGTSID